MCALVSLVLYTFCVADRVSWHCRTENKACEGFDRPCYRSLAINGLVSGTQFAKSLTNYAGHEAAIKYMKFRFPDARESLSRVMRLELLNIFCFIRTYLCPCSSKSPQTLMHAAED